jgi:putative PIN family toxin of toxin-antitoxin system
MKVVFDTNVLLSAFLTEGLCSKLLLRAKRGEFDLYLCPFILHEFRDKLKNKIKATPIEIREAISLVREAASMTAPEISDVRVYKASKDPDDDKVIECAVSVGADYIVTGDSDLRQIGRYGAVRIISPRSFESLFEE